MIYRSNENNYNDDDICKYNLYYEDDIIHEFNRPLKYDKYTLGLNILPDGIKGVHSLRIKVMSVNKNKDAVYTYPVDVRTGVVTYKNSLNPNKHIGQKISKIIAGFARKNLDLLNKYNGYRDEDGRIINGGDKKVEDELKKSIEDFNNMPDDEKKKYISKGVIKYGKN